MCAQYVRGTLIPEHALLEIGLLRHEPFADTEHLSAVPAHLGNQVDRVPGVEALEHLLVHRVEHQHVRARNLVNLHVRHHRLGQEGQRDAAPEVGPLLQERLERLQRAGQVAVGEDVGDTNPGPASGIRIRDPGRDPSLCALFGSRVPVPSPGRPRS